MGCGASANSQVAPSGTEAKAAAAGAGAPNLLSSLRHNGQDETAKPKEPKNGGCLSCGGTGCGLCNSSLDIAAHKDKAPAETPEQTAGASGIVSSRPDAGKLENARSIGVIRLDYDYPPARGDIDHPGSFGYDVFYRVIPGLTFDVVQQWEEKKTEAIEKEFVEGIRYLEEKGVSGITGDCGFMMYLQTLARRHTKLPVFMSALAQLPAVTCGFARDELIVIFTANGKTLEPMRDMIRDECGVDTDEQRYVVVGCEDVPGFEAVALGEKVNVEKVTPGMVAKAKAVLAAYPNIRAILMECTELPPYSDALRLATGLPVYDAITACNFFHAGVSDNKRFGITWQKKWDGQQAAYVFGQNLDAEDKAQLVNKPGADGVEELATKEESNKEAAPAVAKASDTQQVKNASLGVIRLDYDYPPAPGDIDHPGSFGYDVYYRVIPKLTFEVVQHWEQMKTEEIENNFIEGIRYLESKGVSGITGDCGFMMYLQTVARRNTHLPVFMSALAQLPAVTCAYAHDELIAVFTANGETLKPMRGLIRDECGVDTEAKRYLMVGCETVPGFEAVALGAKVDVEKVTPGMVAKAKALVAAHPNIRAILMECTELPPYSDALRLATGLPVYDAITACNFFMAGVRDNKRFGIEYQKSWDGQQEAYKFGANLDKEDKAELVNKAAA